MTQGRGSFRMEMDHYDIVPQMIAEKILAPGQTTRARRGGVAIFHARSRTLAGSQLWEQDAMDLFSKAQEAVRVCARAREGRAASRHHSRLRPRRLRLAGRDAVSHPICGDPSLPAVHRRRPLGQAGRRNHRRRSGRGDAGPRPRV